ncbi:MAG: sigma 54-interacting transcriptional regulator [Melioribacteraceae bacterium]|nr:sigma 54-interacting transcriptional regulator [Melioribacteraceae bacterium]
MKIKSESSKQLTAGHFFSNEIGDMDSRLQSKILRVLEDNEIEKVGSNQPAKS